MGEPMGLQAKMESLLVLLFVTGAMSSSAMGPGRLWSASTITQLGRVGVQVPQMTSTVEAASLCCGNCKAKFPSTTKFSYEAEVRSCYCAENAPGKTPQAEPPQTIGICGNKAFPDVTVGVDSLVAWETVTTLSREVTGVEDSTKCCEECTKDHPGTEIYTYIDTPADKFPMFQLHWPAKCICYATIPGTTPRTYPSHFYAGVCDAWINRDTQVYD